ncbi:MAG: DUF58 domain-containing protein [Planctomycetia bacterium]|nr:DUF58 domain-containing protein [Planctomycetia bacterium]
MSQLIPTEERRRPFPAIGTIALVTGVALLLTYERLESIAEFWGGTGRYLLIALAVYLILWGLKQSLGAMLPGWAVSRLPRWNRHRMAVTGEGVVYVIIMSVMFIGSIIGRSNMLMLVFAMMIGPWVINGWIAFSMLKQTRAKRFVPRSAMAGELVSVEIEVENRKWWLTSWLLAARDEVAHTRDRFQASVLFVRIPSQQKRRGHYQVQFSQRGIYSFGPIELSTHFPLGLVQRGLVINESSELIVHPRVGRLTSRWRHDLWNAAELTERRVTRAGLFDDEFHRIREFREGDNPRAIHWRTTARSGELMVREYHQSRDQDLVLLVELWQPSKPTTADQDRVELAVSFAATITYDHLRQSRDARLKVVVVGSEVVRCDQYSGDEVLLDQLALAVAAPTADVRPIIAEVERYRSQGTRLVVVSTRSNREISSRLGDLTTHANNTCLAAEVTELAPFFVLEDDA